MAEDEPNVDDAQASEDEVAADTGAAEDDSAHVLDLGEVEGEPDPLEEMLEKTQNPDAVDNSGADEPATTDEDVADEPESEPDVDESVELTYDQVAALGRLGIPQAEAEAYAKAGVLDSVVRRVAAAQPTEEAPAEETPAGDALLEFDPEEVAPEMIELANRFNSQQAEIAALKAENVSMREQASEVGAQSAFQHSVNAFDQEIENLGEEYAEMLGVGPTSSLDASSDAYKLRVAMWDEQQDKAFAREGRGLPALSPAELASHSAAIVLKDHQPKMAKQALSKELRSRTTSARPTPRATKDTRSTRAIAVAKMTAHPVFKALAGYEVDDDFESVADLTAL